MLYLTERWHQSRDAAEPKRSMCARSPTISDNTTRKRTSCHVSSRLHWTNLSRSKSLAATIHSRLGEVSGSALTPYAIDDRTHHHSRVGFRKRALEGAAVHKCPWQALGSGQRR